MEILTPKGRRALRRIVIVIGATLFIFGLALIGMWLTARGDDPHGGGFLAIFGFPLLIGGAAILAAVWASRPRTHIR